MACIHVAQAPTANAVAKRRNEIFKRAKLSTLARLIKENEVSVAAETFGVFDSSVSGSRSSIG